MTMLGAIAGLAISLLLFVVTAIFLNVPLFFLAALASMPQIAALAAFLTALLTTATWIVVAVFIVVIVYVFAYTMATIGLLPLIATGIAVVPTTPAPPPPVAALPNNLLENFMRGLMFGMTAGLNLGLSLIFFPVGVAIFIGVSLAFVNLLAAIPAISASIGYQRLLGFLSWIMPMSYLATGVGILLFVINLPSAIAAAAAAGAPFPVRFDPFTATIETAGGSVIGITGFFGGFNLGNFTFLTAPTTAFNGVNPIPGGGGAVGLIGGLSSHETGHTLNAAAFGGVFHWINAVDENLAPFTRNTLAYGELTAESHFQRGGVGSGVGPSGTAPLVPRQHVGIW